MRGFFIVNKKHSAYPYISNLFVCLLTVSLVFSPVSSYAQNIFTLSGVEGLNLPAPGTMVSISPAFNPIIVKGITLYPDNPLKFDFIIDPGDEDLKGQQLEKESSKLINYFMASLTVPEDEMWVNLSPYEKDRIIADGLSQTELGRDLLSQDYILKQLTASLMYPEKRLGAKFWEQVYAKAQERYGTTEIPMNTFNKVWIIPDKANVHVRGNSVFVVDRHLKVMLEEDYLALEANMGHDNHGIGKISEGQVREVNDVSSEVVREVLLPAIEREVNEGKNFAALRQIFNSMILATWYKQNLKESVLGRVYVNQNKTKGIDLEDRQVKEKIYNRYVEAFKKGVYNYIKEDYVAMDFQQKSTATSRAPARDDQATQQMIPRKYFSGGIVAKAKVSSSPVGLSDKNFSKGTIVVTADAKALPKNQSGIQGSSPISKGFLSSDTFKVAVKEWGIEEPADNIIVNSDRKYLDGQVIIHQVSFNILGTNNRYSTVVFEMNLEGQEKSVRAINIGQYTDENALINELEKIALKINLKSFYDFIHYRIDLAEKLSRAIVSNSWNPDVAKRNKNIDLVFQESSFKGLEDITSQLPDNIAQELLKESQSHQIILYGNAHSKGYPAYTFASFLKYLVENGIKPYLAVEKRISLESDIKEFVNSGTVTPEFANSLAKAHHEVELYRVARQLGLEIIPFDPRVSPYWQEGMHVDQEMFNMLDHKIFQKDPGATVIVWGGRDHMKDIKHYNTKSVVLEGEEFVTYQSEGPSLGHLLRKQFGDKTLIITNASTELPGQQDTEIELYISASENRETEDLSFIHLRNEDMGRKRGSSSPAISIDQQVKEVYDAIKFEEEIGYGGYRGNFLGAIVTHPDPEIFSEMLKKLSKKVRDPLNVSDANGIEIFELKDESFKKEEELILPIIIGGDSIKNVENGRNINNHVRALMNYHTQAEIRPVIIFSNSKQMSYLTERNEYGSEDQFIYDIVGKGRFDFSTSSPLDNANKNLGGIDLNPNNFDIQTQGHEIELNMPFDAQTIMNSPIDGFAPVIIQIVPANLPLLLGNSEQEDESPQLSSLCQFCPVKKKKNPRTRVRMGYQ